jgi:hypothetical protein
MKNLLWSVVLITALAFVFLACGPEEDPPLSLNLPATAWTNEPLTADGDSIVGVVWTGPGGFTATSATITPTVPGIYYVTVTAAADSEDQPKTGSCLVGPGELKGDWEAIASLGETESVTITVERFQLETDETPPEHFAFNITNWEKVSKPAEVTSTLPSDYTTGYKMTGTIDSAYTDHSYVSITGTQFYIFVNSNTPSSVTAFYRNSNTSAGGNFWVQRAYERP